jgi:hypothetical protein
MGDVSYLHSEGVLFGPAVMFVCRKVVGIYSYLGETWMKDLFLLASDDGDAQL